MSQNGQTPEMTPVLRLGLKRVQLDERVLGDQEIRIAPFVVSAGEEGVRSLLSHGTGRRFPDQGRLFVEGEPATSLLLVLKGEVRMFVGACENALEIGIAGKGDVVGEGEALGLSEKRGYTARACGEVEVIEFPRDCVAALTLSSPALRQHLQALYDARRSAVADMADFLNRW